MTRSRQKVLARRHKPDHGIILLIAGLLLVGLVVIYSIGPALQQSTGITVVKQFFSVAAGVVAFTITAALPLQFWAKVQNLVVAAAILTSVALFAIPGGVINPDINGAKRWLVLGPLSFQPSELIKFALVLYLSSFLAKQIKHKSMADFSKSITPVAIILGILAFVVVILQKDLGTMQAILIIVIMMLFMAGAKLKHLFYLMSGAIALAVPAILLAPHRITRLMTFIDPDADITESGYHIHQALIGFGSGGLFGQGLGRSVQAYGYLPEAANDSIFAIIGEKFGFIGAVIVLAMYGALLFRVLKVVDRAPNSYFKVFVSGVFAWLLAHVLINTGAVLGILPLTGITLPFISYGGSSLLFIMAALGIVFNISRYGAAESTSGRIKRRRTSRT